MTTKDFGKPFLSGKGNIEHKSSRLFSVENDEIIRNDKKNADIMNDYFVNVTKSLRCSGNSD